ncbi:NAD(P)-dependent oxidoreductase [Micromonospora sp. NPDC051196]|uniref:NAD(P)-dependent oxidoreductase n=1 Tax=Micromonospora sp. NPDC051196 TaxID=3155281 RepID=UPI00343C5450
MSAARSSETPVGVIGTGQLGKVLTDRFLGAGYQVIAYDIDPAALARLHPDVTRASGPAEVAATAPTVVTCVSDPAAVRDCILGAGGLLGGAGAQTLVIEMTTSSPETTRDVGAALARTGAAIVDAPVSRGVPAAIEGTLSVWLGGEKSDVDRAMPYLTPLATDILHVGPLGAGHAIKAVNMMLMGVNLIATAEAVAVAGAYRVGLDAFLDVLNASSGGNFMTSNHFPRFVQSGSYRSAFSAGLMRKDLRVARDLAEEVGAPALYGTRALEIYNMYLAQPDATADDDNMLIVPFLWNLLGADQGTEAGS